MNEELTREVLEAMKKCNLFCHSCGANWVCNKYDWQDTVQALATALLEERARPKDDVWKNAPYWAKGACVIWDDGEGQKYTRLYNSGRYTRELPKSRARQIAEKEGHWLAGKYGWSGAEEVIVTNRIESALTKYAEELDLKENTDD